MEVEEYTGNKLYKVMKDSVVEYLCADSTPPNCGIEITQEEWNAIQKEIEAVALCDSN